MGGGYNYRYSSNFTGTGGGGCVLYRSNFLFLAGVFYKIFIGDGGSWINDGYPSYITSNNINILTANGGGAGRPNDGGSYGGDSGCDSNGVITTYNGGSGYSTYPYTYFGAGAGGRRKC